MAFFLSDWWVAVRHTPPPNHREVWWYFVGQQIRPKAPYVDPLHVFAEAVSSPEPETARTSLTILGA